MPQEPARAVKALIEGFFDLHPEEATRVFERIPVREIVRVLEKEPIPRTVILFDRLAADIASQVLQQMEASIARKVLSTLEPVRAVLILAQMDEEMRGKQVSALDARTAKSLQSILSYPSDRAGNLMDPAILTFHPETTAREVLSRLRAMKRKRIHDIFIVDPEGHLLGMIPLQEVAIAMPNEQLGSLYRTKPISIHDMATREEVVELLEQFKMASLPVVDFEGRMLGVIRYDALVKAAEEEMSADLQTMVGASKDERALSSVSFAVRKRLPWLHINLATAFLAAAVVGLFENIIAQFTALAVLLPVVAGQSGNTGAQALAVTMRGLALREIRVYQWLRVFVKEFKLGLINGVAVALTTSVAVYIWSQSLGLALVIGVSMICSMVAAGVSGMAIPITLTAIGQDPAQSSSIILTTVTDVVGFFSFLGIATLLATMI